MNWFVAATAGSCPETPAALVGRSEPVTSLLGRWMPFSRIFGAVLDAFLADFQKHGAEALVRVREERPADYWRIATQLLPNEVLISAMVQAEVSPLAELGVDEMRGLLETIKALRAKQIEASSV